MSPEAPAPLAPPRRARVRALLLALLVPALSLVVVFTTPTTAHALDPGATKVIQGALASPPAQIIRWTPAGRAITLGLGLGMLAYETRDMWLPGLKDEINPEGGERVQGGPGDYTRTGGNCVTTLLTSVWEGADKMRVIGDFLCQDIRNASGNFEPSWGVDFLSRCWNPATGAVSAGFLSAGKVLYPGVAKTYLYNNYLTTKPRISITSPALCAGHPAGYVPFEVKAQTYTADINFVPLETLTVEIPESMLTTTVNVRCADGGTGAVVGSVSAQMTGSDGVNVPSCSKAFPGSIPWDGGITKTIPGKSPQSLGTFDTDPDLFNQWRDCFGPTGVICKTEVYVDGQRCVIGRDVCVIWWRINRGEPERVECRFGTHSIGTEYCMPLKQAYGTGTKVTTATTTQTLLDPQADPEAVTAASTTTAPSTSSNPTTGPNPSAPTAPEPTTSTDPNSQNCYGGAWTWNPVDWVFVPVKCALKWAFVPKTALATRVANIKTGLDTKAPFAWVSGIAAIPAAVPGGACPDWNVKVGNLTKNVVCESSYTDAIRGARPVLLIFMTGLAIWPLVRSTAYAAFPILKPQPGVLR